MWETRESRHRHEDASKTTHPVFRLHRKPQRATSWPPSMPRGVSRGSRMSRLCHRFPGKAPHGRARRYRTPPGRRTYVWALASFDSCLSLPAPFSLERKAVRRAPCARCPEYAGASGSRRTRSSFSWGRRAASAGSLVDFMNGTPNHPFGVHLYLPPALIGRYYQGGRSRARKCGRVPRPGPGHRDGGLATGSPWSSSMVGRL